LGGTGFFPTFASTMFYREGCVSVEDIGRILFYPAARLSQPRFSPRSKPTIFLIACQGIMKTVLSPNSSLTLTGKRMPSRFVRMQECGDAAGYIRKRWGERDNAVAAVAATWT